MKKIKTKNIIRNILLCLLAIFICVFVGWEVPRIALYRNATFPKYISLDKIQVRKVNLKNVLAYLLTKNRDKIVVITSELKQNKNKTEYYNNTLQVLDTNGKNSVQLFSFESPFYQANYFEDNFFIDTNDAIYLLIDKGVKDVSSRIYRIQSNSKIVEEFRATEEYDPDFSVGIEQFYKNTERFLESNLHVNDINLVVNQEYKIITQNSLSDHFSDATIKEIARTGIDNQTSYWKIGFNDKVLRTKTYSAGIKFGNNGYFVTKDKRVIILNFSALYSIN